MAQSYAMMYNGGLQNINTNILYGSMVTVTEEQHNTDGSTDTTVQPYYLYRFVKATDTNPDNTTIFFEKTIDDGNYDRDKPIEVDAGGQSMPTIEDPTTDQFSLSGGGSQYTATFTPTDDGVQTDSLDIETPDGDNVGSIGLQGTGEPEQEIDLALPDLETTLVNFATNFESNIGVTPATASSVLTILGSSGYIASQRNFRRQRLSYDPARFFRRRRRHRGDGRGEHDGWRRDLGHGHQRRVRVHGQPRGRIHGSAGNDLRCDGLRWRRGCGQQRHGSRHLALCQFPCRSRCYRG